MKLYTAVTPDQYELPLADSMRELAEKPTIDQIKITEGDIA